MTAAFPVIAAGRSSSGDSVVHGLDSRPVTRNMAPDQIPFILNAYEAATWLGIHHDTLRGLAAEQKIPSLRVGGKLAFRRDEILASFTRAAKTKAVFMNKGG